MSIRCFIAIEIPDEVKRALGRMQQSLRGAGVKVRWMDPRVIHLTTKFLGDVADADIPKVCEVMKRVSAGVRPMELSVTGVGSFPARGAPRVLWAGVEGDVEPLADLVARMDRALADDVGIQAEHRPFRPHLTLGRVKSSRNVEQLQEMMTRNASAAFGDFQADVITLFMSKLEPEGAIHTPMANVAFAGE